MESPVVNKGYGEYIAYYTDNQYLTSDIFDKIYEVFNHFSVAEMVKRNEVLGCHFRYELIRNHVKKIDPNLDIAFVPRTLYELVFIHKSIREEINRSICPYLSPDLQEKINEGSDIIRSHHASEQKKRKCWHVTLFNDWGDNRRVKNVVYRLNQVMVKRFKSLGINLFLENELEFFRGLHHIPSEKGSLSLLERFKNGLEINDEIIRNAVALECSEIAQKSVFLYRGAEFQRDLPYKLSNPMSLSYGTGLFAGCLYDMDATAYYYMRKSTKDAYVVAIPFEHFYDSPFFIPPTNAAAQLYGTGEIFHGRTKVWDQVALESIHGIFEERSIVSKEHLRSECSFEELVEQFEKYKSTAIQLKSNY